MRIQPVLDSDGSGTGGLSPRAGATQPPKFLLGGKRYYSRSEAACGVLMELFIPGYCVCFGTSFQIPIGRDKHGNTLAVDFLVQGVLFEYHPPRASGKSKTAKKLRQFYRETAGLSEELRYAKKLKVFDRLSQDYKRERMMQIRRSRKYRHRELVVATLPEDFYQKIILRFGGVDLPGLEDFLELFRRLQEQTTEERSSRRTTKQRPAKRRKTEFNRSQKRSKRRSRNRPGAQSRGRSRRKRGVQSRYRA